MVFICLPKDIIQKILLMKDLGLDPTIRTITCWLRIQSHVSTIIIFFHYYRCSQHFPTAHFYTFSSMKNQLSSHFAGILLEKNQILLFQSYVCYRLRVCDSSKPTFCSNCMCATTLTAVMCVTLTNLLLIS